VHQVRRGGADAALVVALAGVERAPLGTAVDGVLLDHEAAVLADGLPALLVDGEVAAALRALEVGVLVALALAVGLLVGAFAGSRGVTHGGCGRVLWSGKRRIRV